MLYVVEDHAARAPSANHAGPPRVTSDAYRENWERIFRLAAAAAGTDAPN